MWYGRLNLRGGRTMNWVTVLSMMAALAACGDESSSHDTPDVVVEGEKPVGFAVELVGTVVEGSDFSLIVRTLGTSGGITQQYQGTVTVSTDWGDLEATEVELTNGAGSVKTRLNREGTAILTVTDGTLTGTAPIDVGPPQWNRFPKSPILRPNTNAIDPWAYGGTFGPSAVAHDGAIYLYFATTSEHKPNLTSHDFVLGRARSDDGGLNFVFDPDEPMWTPAAANSSGLDDPMVLVASDGIWHMWYTAIAPDAKKSIRHATAPDGLAWVADDCLAVDSDIAIGWTGLGVAQPSVLEEEPGVFRMWFTGFGQGAGVEPEQRIGMTVGTCSSGFEGANIVFETGLTDSWEASRVFGATVWRDRSVYKMLYAAGGFSTTVNALGYATSGDGEQWTRSGGNPVLTKFDNNNDCDHKGLAHPSTVMTADGKLLAFFATYPQDNRPCTGRANLP